jgi:repressor LexA
MLGDKIKDLRKKKGMTQQELADYINVSRSTIGMLEGNKQGTSSDTLVRLAKALETTAEYLLLETENENKISDILDLKELNKINIDTAFITIPIVGSIRAGYPMLAEDNLQGYIPVMKGNLKTDSIYFGLKVKGDSMNLEFEEGTILVIEKTPCIENGEIGVVRIDGLEATVKKVVLNSDMITLIPMSTNSMYIPQMYNIRTDDIEIIGRVKQAIKTY